MMHNCRSIVLIEMMRIRHGSHGIKGNLKQFIMRV
jgi:hypothetical protein